MAPSLVKNGADVIVERLSWNTDGARLAISFSYFEENGGALRLLNPATDRYFLPADESGGVPLAKGTGDTGFYEGGVYLPDDRMFVVRRCCTGEPPVEPRSAAMTVIDPGTGATVRMVAKGDPDVVYLNLDADASGRQLLYLAGTDLMVSRGTAAPTTLARGYQAADW
jgi:hypothetical protein